MAFLDEELRARVATARILVVGAGGIGCELIKNLVLTGFSRLVVVRISPPRASVAVTTPISRWTWTPSM